MSETVAVVGLGYVGLPVALALANVHDRVIGFDIAQPRIASLAAGDDWTGEVTPATLAAVLAPGRLHLTADAADLAGASAIIVTVPTPIDKGRRPDLSPLETACRLIGPHLAKGAVVIFESTVYPGVTRDICRPWLATFSGLAAGRDFQVGYSPERINPGDHEHTLARIVKIVSAEDAPTLDRVAALYGAIVPAGLHRAPSIEVAEAAKVIENTQRDLNIALMNELAIIFDRLGISTRDVLAAAGTKWNFLPFTPGLVGGHCIGVDPYYLTARAEEVGYTPEIILAGRRINDGMGRFLAGHLVKMLIAADRPVKGARIAILGLTFKENIRDLRNSRVPDIIAELREWGIEPDVADPCADAADARRLYGVDLVDLDRLGGLDGVILAVAHRAYLERAERLYDLVAPGGILIDVKAALRPPAAGKVNYWSL